MRRASDLLARVSLALVGFAIALYTYALARGIHCVGCDRYKLSPADLIWWTRWLDAKDLLAWVGVLVALVAMPLASRRRPAIAAILIAVGMSVLTPR